ncbi:hypothetical protein GJ688_15090 [Heliobacillus mobilis]|uniref:Uncharacterized protein n=1 Tax=Heliobacterium mobile TaxID=28064 RepID=A0A6I3SMR9_HELMO|nr:hypothetical protein [Heliobacterium mobile]MTV50294.1 hypothetical protein [Heliobacterium mobile]
MRDYHFWRKWLFFFGLAFTVFGLVLAFFSQTAFFDLLFNDQINPTFWPDPFSQEPPRTFQAWIYGVLGATCAGWGVFIAFLAHYPLAKKEPWAWQCIFVGITLWFFVDTAISLYFGVIFNAVFNVLLLLVSLVPLWMMKGQMAE